MVLVTGTALGVGAAVAVILSAPRISRVERPPPSLAIAPTTATVTREVIQERYTFSGHLSAAEQPRALPSRGVITATPLPPGVVPRAGQSLIEINGRPVIGLSLPFPLWRDLVPGTVGKDVSVVQAALHEIGLYGGPGNGVYDRVTRAAVRALYLGLGYPPPTQVDANPTDAPDFDGPGSSDAVAEGTSRDGDVGSVDGVGAGNSRDDAGRDSASNETADGSGIVLPAAEVVALGGGPWRLNLSGLTVGSVLDGRTGPSLVSVATQLMVDDKGRLAAHLADGRPRQITLVVGDASTPVRVRVLSTRQGGNGSRVAVRATSRRLPRGTVAGSVVVRSTSRPVTSVPVTALRPTADGRTLVRAVVDGQAQDVPVRVGLRGDRLVEVQGRHLVPGRTVELG